MYGCELVSLYTLCKHRSSKFRPSYGRLHEVRALVHPGTPLLAATATATQKVRKDIVEILDMKGYQFVYTSPDHPNIYYDVKERTDIESDLKPLIDSLVTDSNKAKRVLVYCKSLNTVADLFATFQYALGRNSFHPPDADPISDNRLFGMYHANTSQFREAYRTQMV